MKVLLPLFFLIFWAPLSFPKTQSSIVSTSKLFEEAFRFFSFEEDQQSLEAWIVAVLKDRPADFRLVELTLEYLVAQKDRRRAAEVVRRIAQRNFCGNARKSPVQRKFCDDLEVLWTEGVWGLPFLESSSGKIVEARAKVLAGECEQARASLEDLEAAEGPLRQVLELKERVYICLKDDPRLESLKKQRERLEFFK